MWAEALRLRWQPGRLSFFKSTGKGASAAWEECQNDVCTNTFINVSENMSRENGTKFSSTTLCLSRISANVDTGRIISDNFGCADAALSIDKKLTRASSSATVPLFHVVCRIEGDVTICEEVPTGETAMVSASWTGAGNLEPTNEKFKFKSKNFMAKFDFKGEFRNATASGQVNGDDLGATSFANLFNSKSGQLFVCHGDC